MYFPSTESAWPSSDPVLRTDTVKRLVAACVLSFVFHFLLLAALRFDSTSIIEQPIEITLLSEPVRSEPKLPEQIVSPSEAPEQQPPLETRFRSDRDTAAEVETIARGIPDAGIKSVEPVKPSPPPTSQPSPDRPDATAPKAQSRPPQSLRLSGMDLVRAMEPRTSEKSDEKSEQPLLDALDAKSQPKQSDAERTTSLERYVPFRSSSVGALFSGRTGAADHLPTVQDGEITLLNAKADRHAVFVRRVALQVFGALRQLSWSEVPYERIRSAQNFVLVQAVMSSDGKLIKVELQDSSGSSSFDQVMIRAAERGTWDQNPPPSARIDDGTIRFIFKARSWSRRAGDMNQEQRWLLLSTGLL